MPKRTDIHKVLVIGSGPIVIGQPRNLTMQAPRPALPCGKRATKSFWQTPTPQPL